MGEETHVVNVLVIDDELGPRESLRMLLKNDCEITCTSSVDEGMDVLRGGVQPDLIIMDIRMPGKSGIDGLREIRNIDPVVSIVMLTGFGSLETAQDALRLGANDYINKPFDTRKMQEVVRRYAERTRLERKRSRMLGELREMNTRLINDLADKDHLASLGQTSAEFVHDLRNPLTIVSGYVDLLTQEIEKTKNMNGHTSEYLDVIDKNVRRCCELSKMWQRFGKDEAMTFEAVPLSKVMEDLSAGIDLLASTMEVEISLDVNCKDLFVNGSSAQLIRAIHNIVSNAIQATEPGKGIVRVSCEQTDSNVTIRVEDNGCGMSEEVRAKIFDPYFTTKEASSGTGLGMGIAKSIIDDHAGSLEIESEEGKGAAITIVLPLMREAAQTVA